MGEFRAFLEELFEPVGGVGFRRMFGGVGIYREGIMFALASDDVLYLKADEVTIPRFEAEGCGPFTFESRGRTMTTSYRRLPERLFDEPEEFRDWALAALAVAERSQKAKPKSKKRKSAKA
jgi:DNA transformation protein